MAAELTALGAIVAAADWRSATATERQAVMQGMRASLLCAWLGVERESAVWPFVRAGAASSPTARMLGGLFEPLGGIGYLGTLAGAADLDPMDPGPSHTVLPATLAACVASTLMTSVSTDSDAVDHEEGSAVLAGIEAGWRLRRAVTGTRPGVGFHSPGVFGAVAAAAAGARRLHLDAAGCAQAVAIALTRASGLAINSAASTIGMTHFGWGAAHGLEAALLAAEGWQASTDVERALASLFGAAKVDVSAINRADGTRAAEGLVFKRYPCNIYLNLVAVLLDAVADRPVDRVQITMPWIPHLDCPAPRDIRQARNSAQAVAAIVGAGDASYAAFSGPPGAWVPTPAVSRLLACVELVADRDAPTRLDEARVGVRAWRGAALVLDATRAVRDNTSWGVEHARRLLGAGVAGGAADALYVGSVMAAYEHVNRRRQALKDAP